MLCIQLEGKTCQRYVYEVCGILTSLPSLFSCGPISSLAYCQCRPVCQRKQYDEEEDENIVTTPFVINLTI